MASIYKVGARWRAQVRRRGAEPQSDYFPSRAEAQRWARMIEHQHDMGGRTPKALRTTLGALLDQFRQSPRYLAQPAYRTATARHAREMGDVRLDEFGPHHIVNLVHRCEKRGAGPATILGYIGTLTFAMRYGGAQLGVSQEVAAAIQRVKPLLSSLRKDGRVVSSPSRERRVTQEELRLLKQGCESRIALATVPLWEIILFAITTAMRQQEIAALTWKDIDLQARTALIRDRKDPRRKIGNNQIVPLLSGHFKFEGAVINPVDILLGRPKTDGPVFGTKKKTLCDVFSRLVRSQNIKDLHFHDLRHEGVSLLFEAGFSIPEVALVSGHKTWTNLARYTQLKPETLHVKLMNQMTTTSIESNEH